MKQGYLTDAMYGRMNKTSKYMVISWPCYNKTFGDFSINAALGTSINVSKANSLMIDSKTASLYRPNVFTVSNIIFSSKGYINLNN